MHRDWNYQQYLRNRNRQLQEEAEATEFQNKRNYQTCREFFYGFLKQRDLARMSQYYALLLFDPDSHPKLQNLYRDEMALDLQRCSWENPTEFVLAISKQINYYEYMVERCFRNSSFFHQARKNYLNNYLNTADVNQPIKSISSKIEMLLNCCDEILKRKMSDLELEPIFSGIETLFNYLTDHETFMVDYTKMLQNRAKSGRFNCKMERDLCARLERIKSTTNSYKLKRMISDYEETETMVAIFKNRDDFKLDFDLNLVVLNELYFEFPKSIAINLPNDMERAMKNFTSFHELYSNRRKLSFNHTISSVNLETKCFTRNYIFDCNMVQFAILDVFNRTDSISVKELEKIVGTNSRLFESNLKTFLDAGLVCMNEKKTTISLNLNYSPPLSSSSSVPTELQKIDFSRMNGEISEMTEPKNNERFVESDRKNLIQAQIVSLMKSERELSCNKLIQHTIQRLKLHFSVKVVDVKSNLEYLITKKFIERKPDNTIHYIP